MLDLFGYFVEALKKTLQNKIVTCQIIARNETIQERALYYLKAVILMADLFLKVPISIF